MLNYEQLEESLCNGASSEIINCLKKEEDTVDIVKGIELIKNSFKGELTDEEYLSILETLLKLHNIAVYRGKDEKPRESGLLAFKIFLFSLHEAGRSTNNSKIMQYCIHIEKTVLKMKNEEILNGLGIQKDKEKPIMLVDRFKKSYMIIVCSLCLLTIATEIVALITGAELSGFATITLILLLVSCFLLFRMRKKLDVLEVKKLNEEEEKKIKGYVERSLK